MLHVYQSFVLDDTKVLCQDVPCSSDFSYHSNIAGFHIVKNTNECSVQLTVTNILTALLLSTESIRNGRSCKGEATVEYRLPRGSSSIILHIANLCNKNRFTDSRVTYQSSSTLILVVNTSIEYSHNILVEGK